MTDCLPIRKHSITPRYSEQVKQSRGDGLCLGSHGRSRLHHAESQATWAPCPPCTSELFCWALCVVADLLHEHTQGRHQPANVPRWWRTCPVPAPVFSWNVLNVGIAVKTAMWHGTREIPKQWRGFFFFIFFNHKSDAQMHHLKKKQQKKTRFEDWNSAIVNFSSQWERNYCFYPLFKGHPEIGLFFWRVTSVIISQSTCQLSRSVVGLY